MRSITKKMISLFIVFMLTLLTSMAFMNFFFLKEFKIYQNQKKMEMIGGQIEDSLNDNTVSDIQDAVFEMAESFNVTIRILDQDDDLVLDTMAVGKLKVKKASKDIIDLVRKHKKNLSTKDYYFENNSKDGGNNPHLVYIQKLQDDSYLIITRTIRSIDEDIETSNYFLLMTGGIVALIGIGVIYIAAKRFTKPILTISQEAKAIANLDFNKRISVNSKDEIGLLADSMNEISVKLSHSINQLKSDIDQRKQLVRDLSHELKTPITSIKGYTEALKFGVIKEEEQKKKYYDVIVNECDRMADIIHEMLELSKMDNIVNQLQMEEFPVERLIGELELQFMNEMERKQIHFKKCLKEGTMIQADYHLLLRAIKNLLENGIRYTPDQGTVRISIEKEDDVVKIMVENSGSHIPEGQADSIFDVFYKVDESRKRESNTYGIGLAIVKSIVELHQGEAMVRNSDDGVIFSISIPQNLEGKSTED